MSYTRALESGHYIWSDGENLNLDDKVVSEDLIDIFLYKLYTNRREEFDERIKHGRALIHNSKKEIKEIEEWPKNLNT